MFKFPKLLEMDQGIWIFGSIDHIIYLLMISYNLEKPLYNNRSINYRLAKCLGKNINKSKSMIFFLNVAPIVQQNLTSFWNFTMGYFPCKYLGIPFLAGSIKHKVWKKIGSSINSKIIIWKYRWLKLVGKITMIKFVLNYIHIYLISILKMPKLAQQNF